jgi:hypothetical protein
MEAERTWKRWSEIDPSYIRNNFPGFDPKDAKTCVVKTLFSHVENCIPSRNKTYGEKFRDRFGHLLVLLFFVCYFSQ